MRIYCVIFDCSRSFHCVTKPTYPILYRGRKSSLCRSCSRQPCTSLYTWQLVFLEWNYWTTEHQYPLSLHVSPVSLQSSHTSSSSRHHVSPFPHILAHSYYKDVVDFCQCDGYKVTTPHLFCISLIPKGGWESLYSFIRYLGSFFGKIHTFCSTVVCFLQIYL